MTIARASLPGCGERLGRRLGGVGQHDQRGAELDHAQLGVGAVADDDDVAVRDAAVGGRVHGVDPDASGEPALVSAHELALEHRHHRAEERGGLLERGGPQRVADVAAGQRALGEHAGERAGLVHDRHQLQIGLRHRPPRLAHRLVLAADRKALLHHVGGAEHQMGQIARLGRPAAVQQPPRLGVEVPEAHRHVLVVGVQPALELGVADRRRDRIRVGVAMTRDVDGAHTPIIAGAIASRRTARGAAGA